MTKLTEKVSTLMCIYDFGVLISHIKTDETKCRIMIYCFHISVEITPKSRQDWMFLRYRNTLRAWEKKWKEKQTKTTKSKKHPKQNPKIIFIYLFKGTWF